MVSRALVPPPGGGPLPSFVLFSIPTAYLAYVPTGANAFRLLLLALMSTSPGRSLPRLLARHDGDSGGWDAGPLGVLCFNPLLRPGRSELVSIFVPFLLLLALGSLYPRSGKRGVFLLCAFDVAPSCSLISLDGLFCLGVSGSCFRFPVAPLLAPQRVSCQSHSFCLVLTCFVLILLSLVQHFKKARCTRPGPSSPRRARGGTARRRAQR